MMEYLTDDRSDRTLVCGWCWNAVSPEVAQLADVPSYDDYISATEDAKKAVEDGREMRPIFGRDEDYPADAVPAFRVITCDGCVIALEREEALLNG